MDIKNNKLKRIIVFFNISRLLLSFKKNPAV
jgi:hypothetical protein